MLAQSGMCNAGAPAAGINGGDKSNYNFAE